MWTRHRLPKICVPMHVLRNLTRPHARKPRMYMQVFWAKYTCQRMSISRVHARISTEKKDQKSIPLAGDTHAHARLSGRLKIWTYELCAARRASLPFRHLLTFELQLKPFSMITIRWTLFMHAHACWPLCRENFEKNGKVFWTDIACARERWLLI